MPLWGHWNDGLGDYRFCPDSAGIYPAGSVVSPRACGQRQCFAGFPSQGAPQRVARQLFPIKSLLMRCKIIFYWYREE